MIGICKWLSSPICSVNSPSMSTVFTKLFSQSVCSMSNRTGALTQKVVNDNARGWLAFWVFLVIPSQTIIEYCWRIVGGQRERRHQATECCHALTTIDT